MAQNLQLSYSKAKMSKILVVEDEKLIRWSLKEIFSQKGHEVDTVATSVDALDLALKHPYSLIMADFEIDDETCIEMLRQIKSLQPRSSIVIISAMTPALIEKCLHSLDIQFIVEKPFNSEQILSIAQKALDFSNNETTVS